ncbi:unnamed protein product [Diamesa serratosioi]
MKILLAIFCALIIGTTGSVIKSDLLGKKECTYGPSFWCSNIINAKGCNAVKHCIKAVWEKQTVEEDTDSICKICLDMVTQARDQLESNETMSEIRDVFDGSCDLIPIKVVKKECRRLADDFIPELIEALASQMNPQVVCSTAGLCNNVEIDRLLEVYEAEQKELKNNQLSCGECNTVGTAISHKFHTSSRDEVLGGFLGGCSRLSSFSDACASLVLTYFNDIYHELKQNLNSENICHMSGVCSDKFHHHADDSVVEIKPKSSVGFVKQQQVDDDVPCELCEQLIKHLRDLLVANTTELEFKTVLEGLCKQAKGFKAECISLVDQYYNVIYESLINELDAEGTCFLIGICPKKGMFQSMPMSPLVPFDQQVPKRIKLGENEPIYSNSQILMAQLPIDKLMGAPSSLQLVENGKWCPLCEYFFHFIQEEMSLPKNDDEIKSIVSKTCEKFPKGVRSECHSFVNLYGDAIIALLVQEIDPREMCPTLKFCPTSINEDVDIFAAAPIDVSVNEKNKPTCPLCVLVVKEAQDFIDSSKSKANVVQALDKVCGKLPSKLQLECTDFVETYMGELLDKLVTDFSPKAICVNMGLCPSAIEGLNEDDIRVGIDRIDAIPYADGGDIMTNEIPDFTWNGQIIEQQQEATRFDKASGECLLCMEVMKNAVQEIDSNKSKKQVEQILRRECARMKRYESVCDSFVDKNTDRIIELLAKELTPKQICQQLALCVKKVEADLDIDEAIIVQVIAIPAFPTKSDVSVESKEVDELKDTPECVICEFVMTKLESELKDKTSRDEIKKTIENICTKMPKSITKQCTKFVDQYAELIFILIDTMPPKSVCAQINLCPKQMTSPVRKLGATECTWGPTHWCSSVETAKMCSATNYCKKRNLGKWKR